MSIPLIKPEMPRPRIPGLHVAPGMSLPFSEDEFAAPGRHVMCLLTHCQVRNSSNDPSIDITPPKVEIISEIEPELLGKCALAGQNVLILFENAFYSQLQFRQLKEYLKGLVFLLQGHKSNVRNKGSPVTLMILDQTVRIIPENQLDSLTMGNTNKAKEQLIHIIIYVEYKKYL